MARETKVGLIVGLGVILFVSVFVSDYLSVPPQEAAGAEAFANFHDQTTNQTQLVPTRQPEMIEPEPIDPRDLAAASLEQLERRHGPPIEPREPEQIVEPPFRPGGLGLSGEIRDVTPIAGQPYEPAGAPIGQPPIDDPRLAADNQLDAGRVGPGVDELDHVARVEIDDTPIIQRPPVQVKHTVKRNENLTMIARKHYDGDGNMWRSIRDANPGKVGANGEIVEGVVLVIPKRSTQAADPAEELVERSNGGGNAITRRRVRMVTVEAGDSLSGLAAEHLGSAGKWQLIMDVNADILESPRHLQAGMKLRIPTQETVALIESANNALNEQPDNNEAQPPSEPRPDTPKTYTVASGDSLYRIAKKKLGNGERYKEIFEANRDKLSSPNDIKVGMKLKLPAREVENRPSQ